MTPQTLDQYILSKLKITAGDFPDRLSYINIKMEDLCEEITDAREGFFGVYSERGLVASTNETLREYSLPADIINNLVAVQLRLDGTNWIPAENIDITPYSEGFRFQEDWIRANYPEPKYFIFRNSIFVLSREITAVPNGMRLFYINYPDPIPNLTENTIDLSVATNPASEIRVGFPRQFHELLARSVIIEWKSMYELPLTGREPLYETDVEKKVKRLKMADLSKTIIAKTPRDTGEDY